MTEKKAQTLEDYLRDAHGQKVKLTWRHTVDAEGTPHVRCEVKALGRKPYAFRLKGDDIVKPDEKRRILPKKGAAKQKIEQGVKAAVK